MTISDFIAAIDNAAQLANQAETLKGTPPAVQKRKEAIINAIEAFKRYADTITPKKLFIPQIEQFVFSFISDNLFLLKQELGFDNYHDRFGEEGIKIEIYLKQLMSLLTDYQRCTLLNERTHQILIAFQKNPFQHKVDWQGLQQYKRELKAIQDSFKHYKEDLNTRDFLKPLYEFTGKLKITQQPLAQINSSPATTKNTAADPYDAIKDVYALDRILSYLELGLSVNLDKEKELGEAVIERALQVVGEYFKSTKESPHLSSEMQQKLEALGIPIDRITALRDALSHSGTFLFSVREKISNDDNLDIFKRIQGDLKKIKIVVEKILYRTELKQIKNLISEVKLDGSKSTEVLMKIKEIESLQELDKIENELKAICQTIQDSGDEKLMEKKTQFNAIILNIQLKNEREKIAYLEKINLAVKELSTELEAFDQQAQLIKINELEYFRQYRIAPSKSIITVISESEGVKELPLIRHQIPLVMGEDNLNNLYTNFIKVTFKDYEPLFQQLVTTARLPTDEALLTLEITSLLEGKQLSENEKSEWIETFNLVYSLETKKTEFLQLLKEIKYSPVKEEKIRDFLIDHQLDPNKEKLLGNLLLDFHQSILFNQIFDNYLDQLLQEVKNILPEPKYVELTEKIEEKKQLRQAKLKLLDFLDNNYAITSQHDYDNLVDFLAIINVKKNRIIRSGFTNKKHPDVKKYIGEAVDSYTAFLNAIKKSELASDVKKAFAKLVNSLALDNSFQIFFNAHLNTIIKTHENKRFERFFLKKLNHLKNLTEKYKNVSTDSEKLRAASEMFLLDLNSIWGNLEKISDPLLNAFKPESCLLKSTQLSEKFSLRNYLAHGDALFDTLQPDFWKKLTKNIPLLLVDGSAIIALKQLVEEPAMRHYLLQDIISQKQYLDEQALPTALQHHHDLVKTFKESPRWQNYLEQLSSQPAPSSAIKTNYQIAVEQIFESELREAGANNDLAKLRYLLQNAIDINAKDEKDWSAAFYAIAENSLDAFQEIKKQGATLNNADQAGGMLIHYATLMPNADLALLDELITSDSTNMSKMNQKKFSPLHLAAIKGDEAVVKKLLAKGAEPKIANKEGWTACLLASAFGHKALLQTLVTHLKALNQYHAETDLVNKKTGWTSLMFAVLNQDVEMIKELITLGAKLDQTNKAGWGALSIATFKGYQDSVRILCEKGANVNIAGKRSARPLHLASQQGHVAILEFLLQQPHGDINTKDSDGRSPLLIAIANQQIDIIKKLIAKNAAINLADNLNWTPLHLAAETGNEVIIDLLLEKNVKVNLKNANGAIPSHIAAQQGNLTILKRLKEKGADFSIKAFTEWTHLHLAAARGHTLVVEYLLENHLAEIHAKTADGFTALQLAAKEGHVGVVKALSTTEISSVDTRSNDGQAASFLAVKNGHLDALKALVANGADLDLTGPKDWTLLTLACNRGYLDIVDYLLTMKPAQLLAKTDNGFSALHWAAIRGDIDIVNRLLQAGADPNVLNNSQESPLHWAASAGHPNNAAPAKFLQVIKALVAKDANVLAKNNHDFVLHRAVLSNNPEIIQFIVAEIRKALPDPFLYDRFIDNEEDSPLMWAVQEKKLNAIKTLIDLNVDVHYKNKQGKTALDFALEEDYQSLVSNKNSQEQATLLYHQQEIINSLYLANYAPKNEQAGFNRIKEGIGKFSEIINEEIRKHLVRVNDLEEIKSLQKALKEQGLSAIWDTIASEVEKRLLAEFADIYLVAETENTTPAFKNLLRSYPWTSLDNPTLEMLYNVKKSIAFTKLSAASTSTCESGTPLSRNKRATNAHCSPKEEQLSDYDPLTEFTSKEKQGAILAIASTTENKKQTILTKLQDIYAIKTEGEINQSRKEREKLTIFSTIIESFLTEKDTYLQEIDASDQAELIAISNADGDSVYLSIRREQVEDSESFSIYCPEIHGYRSLPIKIATLTEVMNLYATLLFPKELTEALSFQYYQLKSATPSLQDNIEQLIAEDFRSDKQLLSENHNLLAGLEISVFRELFLLNGEVPNIEVLYEDIFSERHEEISLRSDQLLNALWRLAPAQQIALGKILNHYAIPEASSFNAEMDLESAQSLNALQQIIIQQLKTYAAQNKALNQAELTQFAKQQLEAELLQKHFSADETTKILNNIQGLHDNLSAGIAGTVGITRQGIFLAPAIIQAFNGDSRGLKNMMLMIGSDMAIDHAYQFLIKDIRFVQKFSKIATVLAKSSRFVASPVSKILLLSSFVELMKQMQESSPYSPEYQQASSLLFDNTVFVSVMLAETLGLELGPGGILLDLGVVLHQLLVSANYLREKLPFKVSFWKSLQLSFGFKKTWLDQQIEEHFLYELQLRQINDLSHALQEQFYAALIRVPAVREVIQTVDFGELPREIQADILKNPDEPIDNLEVKYTPPSVIYRKYPSVKKPPEYRLKGFFIQAADPTIFTLNSTTNLSQENTIFQRTKTVCRDVQPLKRDRKKRLVAQCFTDPFSGVKQCGPRRQCDDEPAVVAENWLVTASTATAGGDKFPQSPIEINGGLAALMLSKQVSNSEKKNIIVNFNSCFGDMTLTGGNFLANKTLYVLVENLMMSNLFDPSLHQPVSEFTFANRGRTEQITYLVGANFHPSKIKADAASVHVLLLPPQSARLKGIATNITTHEGELHLGEIGPRFMLVGTQSLIVNFPQEDYFLSGPIQLDTLSFQFEEVRSDSKNPPSFHLDPEQNFAISLREGQITIGDAKLSLDFAANNATTPAPRLIKASNAPFTLFIEQPLNDLSIDSSTHFSFSSQVNGVLTVKREANETLIVHGKYLLENNQTQQAELTLESKQQRLTLVDVNHLSTLLQKKSFFEAIAKQGFSGVTFYDSANRKTQWVGYDSNSHQLDYAGISYRFDKEHGLVAVRGRFTADNPSAEDFANSLSSFVDGISDTSLPSRVSKNAVKFAKRHLINLQPSTTFIAKTGLIPLGLLALRSPVVAHSIPPTMLDLCETNFLRFDGNGLLHLGIWAQGFFARKKLLSIEKTKAQQLSEAESLITADRIINELQEVIQVCTRKAGIDYLKIAHKIAFPELRKELANAIGANNLEKVFKVLENMVKQLEVKLNVKQGDKFFRNLKASVNNYWDGSELPRAEIVTRSNSFKKAN